MPDTGAPWNIPYVAGTDLVSDWPTDSLALANAIDAGLDAAYVGIGTNVVSATTTASFSSSSTSFVDVTGVTVTITPTTATSKMLVIVSVGLISCDQLATVSGVVERDSTPVGDSSGEAFQSTIAANTYSQSAVWSYVDSPATTSAVTYKLRMKTSGGTFYVNNNAGGPRTGVTTITAIEVAA